MRIGFGKCVLFFVNKPFVDFTEEQAGGKLGGGGRPPNPTPASQPHFRLPTPLPPPNPTSALRAARVAQVPSSYPAVVLSVGYALRAGYPNISD